MPAVAAKGWDYALHDGARQWRPALLGIIVQDIGLFVLMDAARLAGPVVVVMQAIVLVVGIALVWLARRGIARGWPT